jgi:two-component system cell cycle sensor histidine kinase/response regulator CckA
MKDEEKNKDELISELKTLRTKYTELEKLLSKSQNLNEIGDKETILVVDDNEYTRRTIVKMLKTFGYNLLEADSSQKAVEIFKSHQGTIHLVLSDVVMPVINGPEMIKKLLKLQPRLKVVFMSGYAGDEIINNDVLEILHSKETFIEKPFIIEEIGLIVRQQLDKIT